MKGILLPLATSVLFSGSYVAAKYTTLDLEPLTATALRYAVAGAFLLTLGLRHGLEGFRVHRRDLGRLALLGLSGIVGYHYFFFLSLRHTDVANTAIINAMSPVVTGVAAALFIGERLSRRNALGVIAACAGIVLLITRGEPRTLARLGVNEGDLFMLLAVGCWVVYALVVKTLIDRYSGTTVTFYATAFGVAFLMLLVPAESPMAQLEHLSPASAVSVLYMGIAGSGVGYLLYNLSIREIGPTRTSSVVYSLVAVLVAVLARAFFDEPITGVMVASAGLVLLALQLTLARPRPCAADDSLHGRRPMRPPSDR